MAKFNKKYECEKCNILEFNIIFLTEVLMQLNILCSSMNYLYIINT